MKQELPTTCPSCRGTLSVQALTCPHCATEVKGTYPLPLLARLTAEEQHFIVEFVKSSGSLKQMTKVLALSYPTVRNYLDSLIAKIQDYERDDDNREIH